MKTQMRFLNDSVLRKISAVSIFLVLGVASALSQGNYVIKDGWWKPVLKKHNIDLAKFNFTKTFDMGMNDTINNLWFEAGVSDSLNERIVPFRNAIIISTGEDNSYWITTAEYARHDIDNNLLILRNGTMERYSMNSEKVIPADSITYWDMSIDIKGNSIRISSK
jgi:hypothetical protein